MQAERLLQLSLAVEAAVDGGVLPDLIHLPPVLLRHGQHMLKCPSIKSLFLKFNNAYTGLGTRSSVFRVNRLLK